MKQVSIQLDDELIEAIDLAAKELGMSQSEFTQKAILEALDRLVTAELIEQHRRGYEKYPVQKDEFLM